MFRVKMVLAVMLVLVSMITANVWNGTVDISWYNRVDTEFTITTAEQLAGLVVLLDRGAESENLFRGKAIRLGANISLNDTTNWQNWDNATTGLNQWIPMGSFHGTFDGNGYLISGMYIVSSSSLFDNVSGLFCHVGSTGIIKNLGIVASYIEFTGNIEFISHQAGGLAGSNSGTIMNCYANVNVTVNSAPSTVGGLVGWNNSTGTIRDSYAIGNVTFFSSVFSSVAGGLVGENRGTITNSYATGNVIGAALCGGLVGANRDDGTIASSYAMGNITASAYFDYTAGVSGNTSSAIAGGLAGGSLGIIRNSYAMGNVTAVNFSSFIFNEAIAGGLTGTSAKITNSYATGNVTATVDSSSYNNSAIVGGLTGIHFGTIINNSYYDTETSEQYHWDEDSKGSPRTTAEMKTQSTFINWDFTDIWRINSEINGGYPHLRGVGDNNTSIRNTNKSNSRYGIRFAKNPVSEKAVISVILPNNERVAEMKIVIYDKIGNVVYEGNETTWNLTNKAGRFVANGSYLVLVEARGVSGKSYWYSAKLGVNR